MPNTDKEEFSVDFLLAEFNALQRRAVGLEEVKEKGYAEMPEAEDDGEITFNTPSGKIEVYSETLKNAGFSPWPTWEEPPVPKEKEFYLLTGKVAQHTQFGTQVANSGQRVYFLYPA